MGYAHYTVIRRDGTQIEAGYGVQATCEHDGCVEQIDRGLDYLCGDHPGGGEHGCGRYFCGQHLRVAPAGEQDYLCDACYPATDEDGRRVLAAGGAR